MKLVEYHPYRQGQPWDRGGEQLLSVPYKDGDSISVMMRLLRSRSADELGGRESSYHDNHHGWDFVSSSERRYHLRESDWTVSLWVMP